MEDLKLCVRPLCLSLIEIMEDQKEVGSGHFLSGRASGGGVQYVESTFIPEQVGPSKIVACRQGGLARGQHFAKDVTLLLEHVHQTFDDVARHGLVVVTWSQALSAN